MARNQPHSTALDRNPEIVAADRYSVIIDPQDFAGQLDLLTAADARCGVHDRMRLVIGRDQYANPVLCDALADRCCDRNRVADFDAVLRHRDESGAATGLVKRLLMLPIARRWCAPTPGDGLRVAGASRWGDCLSVRRPGELWSAIYAK